MEVPHLLVDEILASTYLPLLNLSLSPRDQAFWQSLCLNEQAGTEVAASYAIADGLDPNQAMNPKNKPRRRKHAQPSICTFHRWICTGTHSIYHEVRYHIRLTSSCGLRVCKTCRNFAKWPLMLTSEHEWPFFCHKPITLYICFL
jgi:hypothetical protein